MRSTGQQVDTISTHALEYAISGYSDYSDAVGCSYAAEGHSFYELNFDDSKKTHVWDSKTRLWHERGEWNSLSAEYESWRPRFPVWAFGELRVVDSGVGLSAGDAVGVYRLSNSVYTDIDGNEIRRMRRAPALMSENKRIFYSSLEVDVEPGLGTSGQAEDPQMMLRLSNDGGKTWGSELWRSAGKTGEYSQRVRWNRLGQARRRVFEVVATDPIPWRVTGAYLEAVEGGS